MHQSSLLYDPSKSITKSQKEALKAQLLFREKISANAKRDIGMVLLSASNRTDQIPDKAKRIIPSQEPPPDGISAGYIPDPWIPGVRTRLNIRMIQERTCNHFGVARGCLLSARRTKSIVWPRQVAMYLAKKLTNQSLPQIGRAFGGRDHTTALYAVRKIELRLPVDAALAAAVAEIEGYLLALDS